jgi:hypothetical protein
MNPTALLVIAAFLMTAFGGKAEGVSQDFASLRKAADAYALKDKPGSKLWRIDVTASYENGSLEILEEVFYYFYEQQVDLGAMRVHVLPLEGMHLPKVEGRDWQRQSVEKWQTTPVPANVLSPEEALRRLNRKIPRDPYRSPMGLLQGNRYRGLFDLKLVQVGAAIADSSRTQVQWNVLASAMGVRGDMGFFARTAPHNRWVWWTIVEQDRPDPASNPKGVGKPLRVMEYIYIDAITGKAESHCHGARSSPIPCQPDAQQPVRSKSRTGPLLMASGEVKSASADRLVIITDRNMSVSLRKGTELTFDLTQPHLQRLRLQSGDRVTVKYEKEGNRLVATEINLRPSERPG